MTERNSKKTDHQHQNALDGLGTTTDNLTSRGGLLLVLQVFKSLRLKKLADILFRRPRSNRGYHNGDILTTLVAMQTYGATSLSGVSRLHTESALLKLVGIRKIPGVNTLSRWLHGQGQAGVRLINKLNQKVIAVALKYLQVTEVTLDIDATVIETEKSSATYTYQRCPGYTMMVGTLAEIKQVIAAQLRHGCVSPRTDNIGFIKLCRKLLPKGIRLKCVRIDAAGYQLKVIDYLIRHGIKFVIRAPKNLSISRAIAALSGSDWQPLRYKDGSLSQHEWVARCSHVMYRSDQVFDLVVQRTLKPLPAQEKMAIQLLRRQRILNLFVDDTVQYSYRTIATNIKGLDNSEIVHFYNQRGEHSENRIKELKSDFAAGRPPCSDFDANALYVAVCMLAFNVFALTRHGLPAGMRRARASTLRVDLFALAGKIVYHGRQWQLKLPDGYLSLLSRALAILRDHLGGVLPDLHSPLIQPD